MQLQSYTFTREELHRNVAEIFMDATTDILNSLASSGDYSEFTKILNNFGATMEKLNEDNFLIVTWCDMVSERYFETHPEISDVLLLTDDGKISGFIEKQWIASR